MTLRSYLLVSQYSQSKLIPVRQIVSHNATLSTSSSESILFSLSLSLYVVCDEVVDTFDLT